MLSAMFCLGLFSLVIATSENAASIFITRFFGGIFGSAPVSNVSAALGDIWEAKARGIAVTFYAVAVVGGPNLETLLARCPMIAQKTEILGGVGTQCLAEVDRDAHSSSLLLPSVFLCGKHLDQISRRLPFKIKM